MSMKRLRKRRYKKDRVAILVVASISAVYISFAGINHAAEYIHEKAEERIELKKQEEAKLKAEAEKKRLEEEAKKRVVGVSAVGKAYTYDARKVWEKLSKYDYNNNGKKIVFLTFDDGASVTVTPKILDVLDKENVKATFFLTGENIETRGKVAEDLVKREFNEGHAIANHSYSHNYDKLYPGKTLNLDNFKEDFKKNDELLKSILGDNFSTRVIRCPGGYMSWKGMDQLKDYLNENNMASIDWNALNKDAEGRKKDADELYQEAVKSSEGKEMVVLLMHDTYGKEETAKALPRLIKYFKDNGYEFKTLS